MRAGLHAEGASPILRLRNKAGRYMMVLSLIFSLFAAIAATTGFAQDHDHAASSAADDAQDAHAQHEVVDAPAEVTSTAVDHSAHAAPLSDENLRDPHAYSNGLKMGEGPYAVGGPGMHMADEMYFGGLRMNRLERLFLDGADATLYDTRFWYGSSYDRLVIKAEGEFAGSSFEGGETDLLWSHAVTGFWNTQLGVRNQTGEGPDRNWLAIGMQGVAPYWFNVDVTAYLGTAGRTAVNIEAEYDWLLTQKLVLEPRLEMNLYGKDDRARNTGSGLSNTSVGLRLKYRINRQLVPYFGVEHVRLYGDTAKFTLSETGDSDTRWVAGLRFWF